MLCPQSHQITAAYPIHSFSLRVSFSVFSFFGQVQYLCNFGCVIWGGQFYLYINLILKMLCEKLAENTPFQIEAREGSDFCLFNIALDLQSKEAALFLIWDNKQILISELSRSAGGVRSMKLDLEFSNSSNIVLLPKGGAIHVIGGYKSSRPLDTSTSKPPLNFVKPPIEAKQQQKNSTKVDSVDDKEQGKEQRKIEIENQTLRRSTRARAPVQPRTTTKSAKRQKQQLNNMAKFFECNLDDDDDSFSGDAREDENDDDDESSSSSSSEDDSEEKPAKPRKIKSRSHDKEDDREVVNKESEKSPESEMKEEEVCCSFSVPTRNPYK